MADWKKNRFIIADPELADALLVILTDSKYWSEHIGELINWCADNNAKTEGLTVVFGDEMTLTQFVLKWS